MNDRQGAWLELVNIKLSFKKELDKCKAKARKEFKKISFYLVRGNEEHAEAHREETIKIRKQATELAMKISEIRKMQDELRRTA